MGKEILLFATFGLNKMMIIAQFECKWITGSLVAQLVCSFNAVLVVEPSDVYTIFY